MGMMIGETILSAFLQVLFEKLFSRGVNIFMKMVKGGNQQKTIKQWERQLRMIEAALNDAEQKQHQSNAVKSWMQDLQDLAYDLEDVLDSFATQAQIYELVIMGDSHSSQLKENDPNKSMAQSLIVGGSKTVDHLSFMYNSGQDFLMKIEEINQQMREIISQTEGLGLSVHVIHQQVVPPRTERRHWQSWRESTSLLCEPFVYGRDGGRKEIIHHLLNDENSSSGNYVVIPIVGKGGIGKTTLAQLIYNAEEVNVFALKAWVYVSQVFDAKRITTSILNSITGEANSFSDLNQAQVRLKQVLTNKRFLIILDDMWSEKYSDWDVLRTPLRAGAKGSRVIVTTRNHKVARIMNPQQSCMISLECLSDDDCWHLILQHAFDDANIVVSPKLLLMRDDMIRKCKGLPLVAKALGGLFRTKAEDESEWQDILSSDTLSMSESRVLQVLELSYHVLPSHLKCCFAYCSIFPYDHAFTEEDVILLWMAEGFLPENVGNKQMEDTGHEYFHDLVSKSFFEPSTKGSKYFKMHSLQSDLARHVAGDLWLSRKECPVRKGWQKASYRARHISVSKLDEPEDLVHLENISNFRTFAHFGKHPSFSNSVLDLIGMFQCIRVLSLPTMGLTKLPESVSDLKLLRFLNFSYNDLEELPSSLSNLVNLQTLLLKGCVKLQKLLTNMRCLINLRHLDIDGTSVDEMPLGLGNLTNLQTLHRFIVGANAPIIKELKNLNQLRGKLTIIGLENVVSSNDAGESRLNEKSGLHELELVWEWGNFTNGVDDNTKIDVLDQLRPDKSTRELTLRSYKGVTFPNWLGDPSFNKMVVIRLIGCERCESLPSLGKLPSLKELVIQEMRGLKTLDDNFYGVDCSNPFPALSTLKFMSMLSWESWLQSSVDSKGFSNLQELSLKDCPLLQQSLPSCLPLLHTLEIQQCKQLNTSLPTLPRLQKVIIEDCSSLIMVDQLPMTLRQLAVSNSRQLKFMEFGAPYTSTDESIPLEVVEVVNCQSLLTLLSKDRIEAYNSSRGELSLFGESLSTSKLSYLTKLTISECPYLISFPNDLVLPGLRNLLISVCRNLETLPNQMHKFTSLQDFILTNCPKIHYFPEGGLPKNLISVYFDGLNIEQPIKEWELHNLSSLQKLSISDVGCSSNSIHSFPDDEDVCLPSSLIGLAISGFLNLRSVSFLGVPKLTSLYIRRCPKLKYFVENCVPSGLREIWVVQCPVLKHQMEKDPLRSTLSCITHLRIC